jgi:enamine deaminase RidA (YjgF/YER057c/UK114 family)
MKKPMKSNRDVSATVAKGTVEAKGDRFDHPICYRMQPDKQLLSGNGRPLPCSAEASETYRIPPCLLSDQHHVVVDLEGVHRVALMVTPEPGADAIDQAWEAISAVRAILKQQPVPMHVTMQTVFVRSADDIPAFRKLFEAYYGQQLPVTSFVVQPPCDGEALAIEGWAFGGKGVEIEFVSPQVVTVTHDGIRWVYLAGLVSPPGLPGAYAQSAHVLDELARLLALSGASFRDVPRIWLYQGGITEMEQQASGQSIERYRELNRARTDFFDAQLAAGKMRVDPDGKVSYPASTGIGMIGNDLTVSCMAMQTDRDDVRLLALENPLQTSSFNYAPRFSPKSPKFSRAMAVKIGKYLTTWVSGTASILNSETVHVGNVEKQTEQTLENIERLISRENFARHSMEGAGADLSDLAKVRVYVKRPEDYEKCRTVCEARLGQVPTIYADAEICRSDLLVEIEGVTFSQVEDP